MDKCFAYINRGCMALKVRECNNCNFFKTKEEAEEGKQKAIDRINSLDKEKRDLIKETYYGLKQEV